MLDVYSLVLIGALPNFSLSFPGDSHASMFSVQKLAGIDFDTKVSAACSGWQKAVKASIKAGIFLLKFSLSPLQHISSYQKSILSTTPCCPTCMAAHSCHTPLPLKNLLLRTRQNMSLNNGGVPHSNPFGQQHRQLCLSAPGCFPPERPMALSQSSPVHLGMLGSGTLPLAGPSGWDLPASHSLKASSHPRTLFSHQLWSGGLSEQDKGFALCCGSVQTSVFKTLSGQKPCLF